MDDWTYPYPDVEVPDTQPPLLHEDGRVMEPRRARAQQAEADAEFSPVDFGSTDVNAPELATPKDQENKAGADVLSAAQDYMGKRMDNGENGCVEAVTNIGAFEHIARRIRDAGHIRQICRIGQRVKVHDRMAARHRQPHDGRADEPGGGSGVEGLVAASRQVRSAKEIRISAIPFLNSESIALQSSPVSPCE